MRWATAALLLAATGAGGGAACLLELEPGIACGDGYVDRSAGEQCDPMAPESFEGRCADTDRPLGTSEACNPQDCSVEIGILECGVCGDGLVDVELGEECETTVPINVTCEGGGSVSCTDCRLDFSTCHACGNGLTEPGEDCDDQRGGLTLTQPCVGLSIPGLPDFQYTAGNRRCTPECEWDFSECSLCGNGEIDGFEIVHPETGVRLRPAEVCDTGHFNLEEVQQKCEPVCGIKNSGLSCNVACNNNCLAIGAPEPSDPGCCIRPGNAPVAAVPCCCELTAGGCSESEGQRGADFLCPLPLG